MLTELRPLTGELELQKLVILGFGFELTPGAFERARLTPLELAGPGRPGLSAMHGFERAKQHVIGQPVTLLIDEAREFRAFTVAQTRLKTCEGAPQPALAVAHRRREACLAR